MTGRALLFAVLMAGRAARAEPPPLIPDRFPACARIDLPSPLPELAAVPLRAEILRATARMNDLRLFDGRGREVPYAVYPARRPTQPAVDFDFAIRDYHESGPRAVIQLERPEKISGWWRLHLVSPNRDFVRELTIETAPTPGSWRIARRDLMFDYSARVPLRRDVYEIPPTDDRWLRLTLSRPAGSTEPSGGGLRLRYGDLDLSMDGAEAEAPLRIDRVSGRQGPSVGAEAEYDRFTFSNPVAREDDAGDTRIDLGAVRLPVDRIRLDIAEAAFFRDARLEGRENGESPWITLGSGTIYRFPGMEAPVERIETPSAWLEEGRLIVRNADNPPLPARSVTLEWVARRLFFVPGPDPAYRLCWGLPRLRRPVYETARLVPENSERRDRAVPAGLGAVQSNPNPLSVDWPDAEPPWGRRLFHGAMGLVLAVLAFLLLRLARRLPDRPAA